MVQVKFPWAAESASLRGRDLQQRGSHRQAGLVLKGDMVIEPQRSQELEEKAIQVWNTKLWIKEVGTEGSKYWRRAE